MQVFVAHSLDPSTDDAANELADALRAQMGDARPVVAVVFAAIEHDHERLLRGLQRVVGDIPIVGCTTDGELSSAGGFAEDSAVVAVFCGDDLRARMVVATDLSADIDGAVARAFADDPDVGAPAACMVFADGPTVDAVAVVRAMAGRLPAGTPMFGGTAADQRRMTATRQFAGTRVLGDCAVAVMLYGEVAIGVGVQSGWAPLGNTGTVTRSRDNVVYEIDGQPAGEFYRKYFGEGVELSPDHPLAVGDGATFYLRAPLGPADSPGAISFAGAVPEGAQVRITAASRDEVVSACEQSMVEALGTYRGGPPTAAMIISCAARRRLLGTRTTEEFAAVDRCLGGVPTFGFYSYGEIGTRQGSAVVDFHNETFVAVLFGQRAPS